MSKIVNSKTLFILSVLVSVMFAQGISNLSSAISNVCGQISGFLPIVAFMLIVFAGVTYAAGQFLGAETRARASVWATAMLVGALIGIVIRVVAPAFLSALYPGSTFSC